MSYDSNMEEMTLLRVAHEAYKMAEEKRVQKFKKQKLTDKNMFEGANLSAFNLFADFKLEKQDWYNYLKMDEESYLILLNHVKHFIYRRDWVMREEISCHERLTTTLRFLATGRSFEDLKYSTIMSLEEFNELIPDTCRSIYRVLRKTQFLKKPVTENQWKNIANNFEKRWNFPRCLGAMGAIRVKIVTPRLSDGSLYNRKEQCSMVLVVIVNANYEFLMCNFRDANIPNEEVFQTTRYYSKIISDSLKLPAEEKISTSDTKLPYVFIGDEMVPSGKNILVPFNETELTNDHKIYNYRLSRAHQVVESVFKILSARFAIFHTPINLSLIDIYYAIMCCCALHNYLRKRCANTYTASELIEQINIDCFERFSCQYNRDLIKDDIRLVQDKFVSYFNGEGAI